MSKIQTLLNVIEDVRAVADSLIPVIEKFKDLADSLQAVADALASTETKADRIIEAPKAKLAPADEKQEITYDQVSNTLMAISRKSKEHSMKLRALVKKYGANKLSEISPAHYDAILEEAKVIAYAE